MKTLITVKRNETFELDFDGQLQQVLKNVFDEVAELELFDAKEPEMGRRRRRRPRKPTGKCLINRP